MIQQRPSSLSPQVRLSAYYGLFFMSIGSVMPFAALWFDALNLSPFVTGSIFAAPSIAIVLFTVFIGSWADRLSDWRTAIIICNWIVLASFGWFLLRAGSWDVLVIWTIAGLFTHASTPIMDAAALDLTNQKNGHYGRIRAFGSVGFVVGVLGAGVLFDKLGIEWFISVLLLTSLMRVITAHMLPHFNDASAQPETLESSANTGIAWMAHPGIVLVIVGAALLNASHGFNNIFAVVHWTHLGISTSMASLLWAIGVIAEVALMWSFKSLAQRFSARKCLLFACAVAVFRWSINGVDPSLPQLIFLQCLHAITFGLSFLACVNFIARRVPKKNAAQAQSISSVTVTLFMAVAMWLSGWLYELVEGQAYWAMAVMALLGGICVALSFASDLHDPVTAPAGP